MQPPSPHIASPDGQPPTHRTLLSIIYPHPNINMPPASSQKGTGKKGAGAIARQRSRNTTPSSVPPPASLPPIETKQTEYLDLNYDSFRNLTYEDIVDQNAISSGMPESKNLDGMMTRLQRLQETLDRRHNFCDRGMRLLVPLLRARLDDERSREEERLRREAAEDDERARKANKANKANKKKRKAADSLAPHDTHHGQFQSTSLPVFAPTCPCLHFLPPWYRMREDLCRDLCRGFYSP